jgi:hypothetical protein
VHRHKLTGDHLLGALLAAVLLSANVAACGGASGSGSASPHAVKPDRDNDSDNNDDDAHILNYGRAPSATERRELTSLVSGFYATAAADNGARVCSMLYPLISETVAEDYGHLPGLKGTTCATVLAKLFKREHRVLVGKSSALKIYTLRVKGEKALALVSFGTMEVRQILERRSDGAWKMAALSDTILE